MLTCGFLFSFLQNSPNNTDAQYIKAIVDSFVSVELNEAGSKEPFFYKSFEDMYLDETNKYYTEISSSLIGNTSCSQFMVQVSKRRACDRQNDVLE